MMNAIIEEIKRPVSLPLPLTSLTSFLISFNLN